MTEPLSCGKGGFHLPFAISNPSPFAPEPVSAIPSKMLQEKFHVKAGSIKQLGVMVVNSH